MKPLFIHIPKNAGSATRAALEAKGMYPSWMAGHYTHLQQEARSRYYNYNHDFAFCIVRNPYEKMISAYHHIRYRLQGRAKHDLKGKYLEHANKILGASFDDFLRYFLLEFHTNETLVNYWHFMPQSTFLDSKNEIHVFKMTELNKVEDAVGIKIERINESNHGITNYNDFYSPWSKRLVEDFYRTDFERFNF